LTLFSLSFTLWDIVSHKKNKAMSETLVPKDTELFTTIVGLIKEEPKLSGITFCIESEHVELNLKGISLYLVTRERAYNIQTPLLYEATLVLDTQYLQAETPFPKAEEFIDVLPWPMPKSRLIEALGRAFVQRAQQRLSKDADKHLAKAIKDREELLAISAALSEEHETPRLLDMILMRLRGVTTADAGSLYLVEPYDADKGETRFLRFSLVQNDSKPVNFSQRLMPLDNTSLAGYVAATGKLLNLPRADQLPPDLPIRHAAHFDAETNYPTRSMLTVPITTPAGKALGVVQLINRKRERESKVTKENVDLEVIPFDASDQELASALSGHAAVALENAYLHQEIKKLFEGLVKASVTAIEARDPTTSGHSQRVSQISVALAEKLNHIDTGTYGKIHFDQQELREIEYAALLHDFGKVGVREEILIKAKKLFPWQEKLIRARFAYARRSYEAQLLRARLERLAGGASPAEVLAGMEQELSGVTKQLDTLLTRLLLANEPTPPEGIGPQDLSEAVTTARATIFVDISGEEHPLLTADEVIALSIPRGSLTQEERKEIESHVVHTFEFLAQIPWTRGLRRIPEIAGAHHERVDGRGYPKQKHNVEILPQARILAVSDVFDALTAKDRPYKKAIPLTPALDILTGMAKGGHLDLELVNIFIDSRSFEVVKSSYQSSTSLIAVQAVKKSGA
jgi:HD-GYP domain-containing protein (c-di-GMP phosphodiesterase class II)